MSWETFARTGAVLGTLAVIVGVVLLFTMDTIWTGFGMLTAAWLFYIAGFGAHLRHRRLQREGGS